MVGSFMMVDTFAAKIDDRGNEGIEASLKSEMKQERKFSSCLSKYVKSGRVGQVGGVLKHSYVISQCKEYSCS